MRAVAWMVVASVMSCMAASLLFGTAIVPEVLVGMLGPLVVASGTWLVMEQTYQRDPELLTGLMFKAFAVKMVLFAAYVVIALKVFMLRPVPFVTSFTTYFIALHLTEALWLRRLFADRLSASH